MRPERRRRESHGRVRSGTTINIEVHMKDKITQCPCCGGPLARGFAVKTAGLSFVRPDKFKQFAFVDEDLQRTGFLAKFLPSRARYCPSFLCRSCQVYLVDYGTVLSRRQADQASRSLETQRTPHAPVQMRP